MIELAGRIRYLEELNRQQNYIIQSRSSEVYLTKPESMNPPSMVDGNTAHSHLAPPALVEDADEDKALKKDQGGAENTSTGVLDALNSSPIIHDNARPKNSPLSTDEYTDIGKSSSNGQDDDYHQSGDSSGNQEDASDSLLEKRGRTPVWTSSSDTDETLSKPSASDQPALDEDAEPPGPASVFEFQTSTNTGPSQALVKLSTPEERAEARHRCFAELPVEERKKMVKFHDCIDRKFSFPYHLVKTWEVSQVLRTNNRKVTNFKHRALKS